MMKRNMLITLMVLAGLSFSVAGCGSREDEGRADGSITVKTAPVVRRDLALPVHTSGKLSSVSEMKLSFKVGGIVDAVYADEGEEVSSGQVLASLKLDEIDAQVTRALSGYEKAERDYERAKRLYADSVATLEQVQDAETGFEIAESTLKVARFNRDHSTIRAPADGKVLKRFGEANELVGAGTPIFLFGTTGNGWTVRVGVSDRDIIRIQIGDSATVSFDAYPDREFAARVTEVAETADPLSGVYEVELVIRDVVTKLVSGFVAKVDIFAADERSFFVVPIEALVEADANRGFVYAPSGSQDRVAKISVTVGYVYDGMVAVEAGLEGVAEVVTQGAVYLTEESTIRIVD
jgi:multidrug efflux system membrane fusion protein